MASLLPAPVFIRAGGEIAEAPAPLGVASVALRFATDSAACFMGFLVFRHHVNSSGGDHGQSRDGFPSRSGWLRGVVLSARKESG